HLRSEQVSSTMALHCVGDSSCDQDRGARRCHDVPNRESVSHGACSRFFGENSSRLVAQSTSAAVCNRHSTGQDQNPVRRDSHFPRNEALSRIARRENGDGSLSQRKLSNPDFVHRLSITKNHHSMAWTM